MNTDLRKRELITRTESKVPAYKYSTHAKMYNVSGLAESSGVLINNLCVTYKTWKVPKLHCSYKGKS